MFFIANFMKNPKHQLSPINFIFFNQVTKTDFCSSPALKQFTIRYSIDEMLKTYVLLWCTPQLHLDFLIIMLLNYKRVCRLLTFCNILLDTGSREF